MSQSVLNRLMKLAATRFEHDLGDLHPEDDFYEQLGIDSYQAMEMMTDVEEAFGCEIPDYELTDINTFAALAEVIERRL